MISSLSFCLHVSALRNSFTSLVMACFSNGIRFAFLAFQNGGAGRGTGDEQSRFYAGAFFVFAGEALRDSGDFVRLDQRNGASAKPATSHAAAKDSPPLADGQGNVDQGVQLRTAHFVVIA